MSSNANKLKPRWETTSVMRIISPEKEINCFEGAGLNGLCTKKIPLPLVESRVFEGKRRLTYWCMFAILYSLFFSCYFWPPFFSLFFSVPFLVLTSELWFCLEITVTVLLFGSLQCTAKGPLYSTCRDWYLLF